MSLSLPPLAYPGLPLAPTSTHAPGPGTHVHNKQIVASLAGRPTILSSPSTTTTSKPSTKKPTITIPPSSLSQTHPAIPSPAITATTRLPTPGTDVLALVTRVRTRQVDLSILCVAIPPPSPSPTPNQNKPPTAPTWHPNPHPYPAVLRVEDIRATAAEAVTTHESFRVGDVVRAGVISLGDQAQGWYLSTGRNEWGVLLAWGQDGMGGRGEMLVPFSWREMRGDGGRGGGEGRKVARPF